MIENSSKRILVAPLDWGLGHTTRCVPLIAHLLRLGHHVIVAGNPSQAAFIENTFSGIETIMLEGYNVTYSKSKNLSQLKIVSQVPHICHAIRKEHQWLQANIRTLKPDGIISDNRYGLYHTAIPSVIITHQLQVQTGMGIMADKGLQKVHYKFLQRFNNIWIPDIEGEHNLGGILSHPSVLPHNTQYIGLLSQFECIAAPAGVGGHLLILLSGPEPQRTLLAEKLWEQVRQYKGKVIFVAGSESAVSPAFIPANVAWYPRLSGAALFDIIANAALVICRSGYSSVMDMVFLHKKAILIPTPTQTEQEYLARRLEEKGIFTYMAQKDFHLAESIKKSAAYPAPASISQDSFGAYRPVLEKWLAAL